WLSLAQEHRSQIAPVVPSMLHVLLQRPLEEYDLSELRYIASGAAPLPRETIAELGRRLPHVELREGYGLTESAGLVPTNPPARAQSAGPTSCTARRSSPSSRSPASRTRTSCSRSARSGSAATSIRVSSTSSRRCR